MLTSRIREKTGCPVVLVVEAEVLILLAIADHLRKYGWHVLEAYRAEEAMLILQTEDVPVAVVFMELRLPDVRTGCELVHWIRSHRPGTGILLTSGTVLQGEFADAAGDAPVAVDGFLEKPYSYDDIALYLDAILARVAARPGAGMRGPGEATGIPIH